jgi:hypothetical protein
MNDAAPVTMATWPANSALELSMLTLLRDLARSRM